MLNEIERWEGGCQGLHRNYKGWSNDREEGQRTVDHLYKALPSCILLNLGGVASFNATNTNTEDRKLFLERIQGILNVKL